MKESDRRILDFHRDLVRIPSISGSEAPAADFVEAFLRSFGVEVHRIGDNVVARAGRGPKLLFVSHLDTVPPTGSWTRDPYDVTETDGRVHGLGSNDAKASVAAMTATLVHTASIGGPVELAVLFASHEETGGPGTELAWPAIRRSGFHPQGVVVGEPTGLDIAIAQKGLLILELKTEGDACHVANAASLKAKNAVRELAHDLVALEDADLGPVHPVLGRTTLEPTVTSGGSRRNIVPAAASCYLDLRTVPGISHGELTERVRATVRGVVRVHSERLKPRECSPRAPIVTAAWSARPTARLYGSTTMSDLVFFDDVPAIKCGPGRSERSHTPDEFVLVSEVLNGARFYKRLADEFSRSVQESS